MSSLYVRKVQLKIDNNNWNVTIFDQRFNGCQIIKVRSLSDFIKHLQSIMSIELKCPIKKGFATRRLKDKLILF